MSKLWIDGLEHLEVSDLEQLQAAAPALLDACVSALAWHREHMEPCGQSLWAEEEYKDEPCSCLRGILKSAIEKAGAGHLLLIDWLRDLEDDNAST